MHRLQFSQQRDPIMLLLSVVSQPSKPWWDPSLLAPQPSKHPSGSHEVSRPWVQLIFEQWRGWWNQSSKQSKYRFTVGPPYVRFHLLRFNHHVVLCMRACSVVSDSLRPHGLQPTGPLHPWDFSGKNAGVGYNFLLQGIFRIKRSNPYLLRLLHWQVDSLLLSHLGSYSTWYACIIYWKKSTISRPAQFKPVLFKGQLHCIYFNYSNKLLKPKFLKCP